MLKTISKDLFKIYIISDSLAIKSLKGVGKELRLVKRVRLPHPAQLSRSSLELHKRTKIPINSLRLAVSLIKHQRLDSFAQPLSSIFKFPFRLRLVTQTDAFEDFIHPFGVVSWVEDFVDFFLSET